MFFIIFVKAKLRLGSVKSGKTVFSRLAVALALHYLCPAACYGPAVRLCSHLPLTQRIFCKDDANERNESLLSKSQMQLFLCKGKPAKTLKLYQMLQWM